MSPVPAIGTPSIDLSALTGGGGATGVSGGAGKDAVGGFADALRTKMDQLNESQVTGDIAAQDLASGRADDIAQTMLRVEQANVTLQLATSIRNKAIEAYQEILRMQV